MHVNLTPKLDEYVLTKVKSGRYNNASEVVRDALRRMQDDEERQKQRPSRFLYEESEEFKESIREAIEELDNGGGRTYEGEEGLKQLFQEVRAQAQAELKAERRKKVRR